MLIDSQREADKTQRQKWNQSGHEPQLAPHIPRSLRRVVRTFSVVENLKQKHFHA
jgi:hypothetical protein